MSLSGFRVKAYLFGALTGAFTALSVVAGRRRRRATALYLLVAVGCGVLAVANEEAAQDLD